MGISKLQGKGVTHSQEVEWWRTFMVECVTLFSVFSYFNYLFNINEIHLIWGIYLFTVCQHLSEFVLKHSNE